MASASVRVSLSDQEKSVIKALLNEGWRNQDIQALVNTGRPASINFGRITNVKQDSSIVPATASEVNSFREKKLRFDHITGLSPFDDERLVRSREAMILAVQLFNTTRIMFKAGVFSMLTNVAWTYLLHQYYEDAGVRTVSNTGHSLLLSQMISRNDCPLSDAIKKNLAAMKRIRDIVEHRTIGPFDRLWLPIFQACCLNYENTITRLYDAKLSLGHDLGYVLQFAKLSVADVSILQGFDLPEHIAALDAGLKADLSEGEAENLEYQFKVVYTLTAAVKSNAHFQFVSPESAEGAEIQNVLLKYRPAAELCPFNASQIISKVAARSGRRFTSDKHQKAWKLYGVRPRNGAENPAKTKQEFCFYHAAFKRYTYSQAWADFLVLKLKSADEWARLNRAH